ncbi:hypothetical protein [Streptomyces sp. CS62]|uniref:hypothetical protein n=1 Tax=Streptomyces sp. CS62 TaxID=3119268 RepID=UPI002F942AD0
MTRVGPVGPACSSSSDDAQRTGAVQVEGAEAFADEQGVPVGGAVRVAYGVGGGLRVYDDARPVGGRSGGMLGERGPEHGLLCGHRPPGVAEAAGVQGPVPAPVQLLDVQRRGPGPRGERVEQHFPLPGGCGHPGQRYDHGPAAPGPAPSGRGTGTGAGAGGPSVLPGTHPVGLGTGPADHGNGTGTGTGRVRVRVAHRTNGPAGTGLTVGTRGTGRTGGTTRTGRTDHTSDTTRTGHTGRSSRTSRTSRIGGIGGIGGTSRIGHTGRSSRASHTVGAGRTGRTSRA